MLAVAAPLLTVDMYKGLEEAAQAAAGDDKDGNDVDETADGKR